MHTQSFVTTSPARTEKLARLLGQELRVVGKKRKNALRGGQAFCIALSGELGAGKTLFVQGLARGLGLRSTIQSPTFVIMKRYGVKHSQVKNFWHMDCYRIKKQNELGPLHLRDILKDPDTVIAIEWAERVRKLLPKDTLWIKLAHTSPTVRSITLKG